MIGTKTHGSDFLRFRLSVACAIVKWALLKLPHAGVGSARFSNPLQFGERQTVTFYVLSTVGGTFDGRLDSVNECYFEFILMLRSIDRLGDGKKHLSSAYMDA